jgi:phosphatidylinositol alpha-1,6-mannosyltransferase
LLVVDVSNVRKILLVTNDLGPHAGGIESFILGLLGEMNGHEIVIYTSSHRGDREFDAKLASKYGVEVVRDRARVLLPTPRVNRSVSKVMKEYQSEYIWFGAAAPLGWMAGHLRKNGAKRIVALTHGHEVWWSKVWPFSLIMRVISRQIDVIGYLGEFTKSAMRKAVGDSVNMQQIAPGISIDHFIPGDKNSSLLKKYNLQNKLVIVCVGRLVHRKGQDRLIQAMPQIINHVPNAHLLLVGEGPRGEYLKKLVAKNQLENCVTFVGRVSYDQLPLHLQLGDIFAMPSRSRFFGLEVEGLGIVYLEASSCGIPVIAGSSGGAPDAVLQGETGLVVDGNNPSAIAQSVVTLLHDSHLRGAMSKRGREWAQSQWSWKIWGKRFNQLLLGQDS